MHLGSLSYWYTLRILLAWATFLTPVAYASAQESEQLGTGTKLLTNESVIVTHVRTGQLLTAPSLQMLPIEVVEAVAEKYLGVEAARIHDVTIVGEPPLGATPFYAIALESDRPFDLAKLHPDITQHTEKGEIDGKQLLVSGHPMFPSFLAVENSLVIASQAMLKKLLAEDRQPSDERLTKLFEARGSEDEFYLAVDLVALRPFVQLALMNVPRDFPKDARKFLRIPTMLASAEVALNLTGTGNGMIVVSAETAEQADELESLLTEGIAYASAKARAEIDEKMEQLASSEDPVKRAMAAYGNRMFDAYVGFFSPQREGTRFHFLRGTGENNTTAVATIGILVAFLLPAVQAAREAARRNQALNDR